MNIRRERRFVHARAAAFAAGAVLVAASWIPATAAAGPQAQAAQAGAGAQRDSGEGQQVQGLGAAIGTGRLGALSGGDGTEIHTILVDGTVDGNTAENVVSGHNIVSDGSFGNAAGIATVIQNSGSNVLIQNAMDVNIDFVDPGP